jgi:hypothetical protein
VHVAEVRLPGLGDDVLAEDISARREYTAKWRLSPAGAPLPSARTRSPSTRARASRSRPRRDGWSTPAAAWLRTARQYGAERMLWWRLRVRMVLGTEVPGRSRNAALCCTRARRATARSVTWMERPRRAPWRLERCLACPMVTSTTAESLRSRRLAASPIFLRQMSRRKKADEEQEQHGDDASETG